MASAEQVGTDGSVLPGVVFKQGNRRHVSAVMPLRVVIKHLEVRAAKQRGTVEDVTAATNRPVLSDHKQAIKKYIRENLRKNYILPPLTLNVQQSINFYMPDYQSDMVPGYIVLPKTAKLAITDGGHRQSAMVELAEELSGEDLQEFLSHSVSVMITAETNPAQVHQDFADCSRTKPLPPSLIAAYDRRNPANGLVLDLVDKLPLFKGNIDSSSKTLSKHSNALFLTNQVRQLVKELLFGNYAMPEEQFEAEARRLLTDNTTDSYKKTLRWCIDYLNKVTMAIPALNQIALLSEGVQKSKIREVREQGFVCLTATGLNILGRVGHTLRKNGREDWKEIVAKMGEVDWKKTGDIWQGTIMRDGKIQTQQTPVRLAVAAVRSAIGLDDSQGQFDMDDN